MVQVAEVAAGQLDPMWLGRAVEVEEESQDGPVVHGFRLVSYRRLVGRDRVVLVGENTSVVVGVETRLRCPVEPVVPARWTGVPPEQVGVAGVQPAAGYPVGPGGQVAVPGQVPTAGSGAWGGQLPAVGPGGPGTGTPGGGQGPSAGPVAPWLRRPSGG